MCPKSRRGITLGVLLGFLALGAVLLFLVGRTTTPTDTSPEAGFARDMATHHAQAVQMAFVARDGSTDESLRRLAYDIIVTQTAQRGIFTGWLQQWGLNQTGERPPMAWMAGHGSWPWCNGCGACHDARYSQQGRPQKTQ